MFYHLFCLHPYLFGCMGPCHPVTSDGRTDSEDFSFSPLCIDMVR
ncbi:hypothetical protein Patl1_09791 [Pistacia atlantica]|uniref:Uncharacterized protein n=1 Tax=Pistacia atlantica TaxID=434234 RepID=A0ACC1AA17_9ROSI|nr:hypothetical protein Patl1_09791 [Pistacia atlantica]